MKTTACLAALLLMTLVPACGGSGDDEGGELGRCSGYGRIGSATSCTINLSCVKGKYELVCEPAAGETTVTTCQCLTAGETGKTVDFDPAYCADQGTQEHGPWLKGLASQADAVCGWHADL